MDKRAILEIIFVFSKVIPDIFETIEAIAFTPDERKSHESSIVDFAKNNEVIFG